MPVNSMAAPLFRVRLVFGRGVAERRKLEAGRLDAEEIRIERKIAAEAPRVGELRHEADIRERRLIAETEGAAPRRGRDRLFQRGEAERDPVTGPRVRRLVGLLELAFYKVQHAEVLDRMNFAGDR